MRHHMATVHSDASCTMGDALALSALFGQNLPKLHAFLRVRVGKALARRILVASEN